MNLKPLILLACLFPMTALPAVGFDFTPLRVRNLSPLLLVQSLATAEPARLVASGSTRAYIDLDLASHAILARPGTEQIHLDGETLVATLGLRHALSERLQLGIDLPWVRHDEGALDDFISDWHNFFGLPDGDRNTLPDDELAIRYQRNGEELLNFERPADGLGDLRLRLAWQVARSGPSATALHLALKLPSGDADRLTGSEGWGVDLALAHDHRFVLERAATAAIWAGLGGSWLGDGEILVDQAVTWAANAWLGAGWSPLDWLAFKLQFDTRTPLYDSDLTELGSAALSVAMGGTLVVAERTYLDLYVGEDLAVNTAPDVTFHLGLSRVF